MAKSDPQVAETQRVLDEYQAARVDVVGNPSPDAFAKARFDRAQQALRDSRRLWREVGQYVGNRPVGNDDVPDHMAVGIQTNDNEAAPAALLEG